MKPCNLRAGSPTCRPGKSGLLHQLPQLPSHQALSRRRLSRCANLLRCLVSSQGARSLVYCHVLLHDLHACWLCPCPAPAPYAHAVWNETSICLPWVYLHGKPAICWGTCPVQTCTQELRFIACPAGRFQPRHRVHQHAARSQSAAASTCLLADAAGPDQVPPLRLRLPYLHRHRNSLGFPESPRSCRRQISAGAAPPCLSLSLLRYVSGCCLVTYIRRHAAVGMVRGDAMVGCLRIHV